MYMNKQLKHYQLWQCRELLWVCFYRVASQNGWLHRSPSPNSEVALATIAGRMRMREARHHDRREPRSPAEAMWHQADPALLREIQAGMVKLNCAFRQERHGEPPLTR
jgi:hypothetical protein